MSRTRSAWPRADAPQGGISYIAQVLKRNRTLKVLNLSENKLDVQALVVLAEALVRVLVRV
jgi:protein phosphatase 1 regulatory subunit 37